MKTTCSWCGAENELKTGQAHDILKMLENILEQHNAGVKDIADGIRLLLACELCKRTYGAEITTAALMLPEK
ncbi:MAG: hypothetical protein HQL08_04610 [Nitrospirae bacterium]|nr:hypothetical protein [Nitrospirota bacterium]